MWPKEFWGGSWVKVLFYNDPLIWVENEAGDAFEINSRIVIESKDNFVRLP